MTTYKTILLHAGPPFDAGVGRVAVQLGQAFDARLVALARAGIEMLLAPGLIETGNEMLARHMMDKIDAASGALDQIREVAGEAGIAVETQRLNGAAEHVLMEQVLYADLAVVGQGVGHAMAGERCPSSCCAMLRVACLWYPTAMPARHAASACCWPGTAAMPRPGRCRPRSRC